MLLRPVVESLAPRPGETVLDCTAGLGGHASALAERVRGQGGGVVVLCDLDAGNLAAAGARVEGSAAGVRVAGMHGSFAQSSRRLIEAGLSADVVLADLGFSSNQMDDPGRGLSFMRDGPLDMRLYREAGSDEAAGGAGRVSKTGGGGASELVNTLPAAELAELIREYGEEPPGVARRIAEKIVLSRKNDPIQTTARLAEIVRAVVPKKPGGGIDPATRTFQALRIAVNDELGSLSVLLEAVQRSARRLRAAGGGAPDWLRPGARIGIISFHSLEDRLVKKAFATMVSEGVAEHIGRSPMVADEQEVRENPRSRSAKLRVVRLVG